MITPDRVRQTFEQTRVSTHSYKKHLEAYDWSFQISLSSIAIQYEWDMHGMLRIILFKMRNAWKRDIGSQTSNTSSSEIITVIIICKNGKL